MEKREVHEVTTYYDCLGNEFKAQTIADVATNHFHGLALQTKLDVLQAQRGHLWDLPDGTNAQAATREHRLSILLGTVNEVTGSPNRETVQAFMVRH